MTDTKPVLLKIEQTPQTLREIAQDRMRTAIIEGYFVPGQRLVERPLGDQLGVSRTVIRETIRYLEAEGLVEIIPNRGPIVARLDWDQAQQIYEIRQQLEGSAAFVCAAHYDADFPGHLMAALDTLRATMNDAEWIGVMQATTHFYELIFQQAGHTIAWNIVQRLNGRISRLRVLTLSVKDRPRPGMTHMTAISDAILSRDADASRAAVHAHIADASTIAHRFLSGESTQEVRDG